MIHENFCTDKISSQFLISVTDFTIHESHLCEDFASGSCYFYILQLERLKVWKIIKVFLVLFKLQIENQDSLPVGYLFVPSYLWRSSVTEICSQIVSIFLWPETKLANDQNSISPYPLFSLLVL